jgi:hypothetical protein
MGLFETAAPFNQIVVDTNGLRPLSIRVWERLVADNLCCSVSRLRWLALLCHACLFFFGPVGDCMRPFPPPFAMA